MTTSNSTPEYTAHSMSLSLLDVIASGPTAAHAVTKRMLVEEWHLDLVRAIEAEAREQASLMRSGDFKRAYEAFVRKEAPRFEGN